MLPKRSSASTHFMLSYSCMPNTISIISSHNKAPLSDYQQSQTQTSNKECNCRKKDQCPLEGKCLTQNVFYQATVTTQTSSDYGCFPLCQRFRKFRSEFKWKGPLRFPPTGIFGITSGGGPLISVRIFPPKFAVPFLTNRFFCPNQGNSEKEQRVATATRIGWPGVIGKCRSIFLGYFHLFVTGRFGIMESTLYDF